MAKTDFRSVDEYIAAQPARAQGVLQKVRGAIRKALPDAEEVVSYQIAAYKLDGAAAIYFAGWKEHFSLYPATGRLVEAFEDELAGYLVSKGTIRFPLSDRVPMKLIQRIAKFRAEETLARQRAKSGAKAGAKGAKPPAKSGSASSAKAGASTRSDADAKPGRAARAKPRASAQWKSTAAKRSSGGGRKRSAKRQR